MPLVVQRSASGFAETVGRLVAGIERRELTVFARIDHAAGARAAGFTLEDEVVVIFGSARSGTPLMQADRKVGIELPLRVLVWREGDQSFLGYRDPSELMGSYDVASLAPTLEAMASLLGQLAAEATA